MIIVSSQLQPYHITSTEHVTLVIIIPSYLQPHHTTSKEHMTLMHIQKLLSQLQPHHITSRRCGTYDNHPPPNYNPTIPQAKNMWHLWSSPLPNTTPLHHKQRARDTYDHQPPLPITTPPKERTRNTKIIIPKCNYNQSSLVNTVHGKECPKVIFTIKTVESKTSLPDQTGNVFDNTLALLCLVGFVYRQHGTAINQTATHTHTTADQSRTAYCNRSPNLIISTSLLSIHMV